MSQRKRKSLRFGQKARKILRRSDSLLGSPVVFVQAFAERRAARMNAIAEIFTGFDAAAVLKLP